MSKPTYDGAFWEALWQKTLGEHGDTMDRRAPNAHLVANAPPSPGRALDAGAGHGTETLWLAANGWRVTAVDFAASALERGRSLAAALGPAIAARITWQEADLATLDVEPEAYDLVVCLYVHVAEAVEARVQRMARGVAIGGTLLMVGHRPLPTTSGLTVPDQTQVSVEAAVAALAPSCWEWLVAEERPRKVASTGMDAVLVARRLA